MSQEGKKEVDESVIGRTCHDSAEATVTIQNCLSALETGKCQQQMQEFQNLLTSMQSERKKMRMSNALLQLIDRVE